MKNKWFMGLCALLVIGLALVGCDTGGGSGSGGGGMSLDGTTWEGSGGFLSDAILTFNYPNFKIVSTRRSETGTYTVAGATVTLTDTGGETKTGTISGNTLTVKYTIPDLGTMSQNFTKKS
jgi:hypothetical protein